MVKRCRREAESGNGTAEGTSEYNTVFIDTSLDTHLAMIVSDSDSFSLLKKKLMLEHLQCFPELGEIKIHALKIKRKGHFYHLSDSMLVKSAFEGAKKSWFLSVDASSLKQCGENKQSHEPNVSNQLPLLRLTHNPSVNGHNILPDHTSTSAVHESSLLELMRTQCTNEKVQLSLSNSRREISKDMGTESKHITSEHFKNVTSDSNRMPDLKIQANYDVTSKGTRIAGTTVEHDGNNSWNGVSNVQCSNSLQPSPETGPVAMKKQKVKKHNKDEVRDRSSKENIASNHASGEVAKRPEIVGPANSLVNAGENFSNGMKMGNKDDIEEHLTICASPSSNKSDIGSNRKSNMGVQIGEIPSIHDRYENKKSKNIVDVQCSNFCEEALPSGPAAKKRHRTKSQEVSRNPLKENEFSIFNSDNCSSMPDINILGNSTEDKHNSRNITSNSLFTEPPDNDHLISNTGSGKKSKKKKKKMDETYNLSSSLHHIVTVLPSAQDSGGEGSFKDNGEINTTDLVKPSEVELVLGDSIKPETLSQPSRIYQKKRHGELVQEVVEGNVVPNSSIGTDICEHDTCNVGGKGDLSDIAVGSVVKGAKHSKKCDTANRKVSPLLHVAEVHSLNNNSIHSANENGVSDDQEIVNGQINKTEEEREFSLRHDSELLLSEKSKPLYQGGADVHIKGPVSSADLVNGKAVMELGNFSGSTRKKKRAKKSAAILCQTERDESEQKSTYASSLGANRECNNQSEKEAENFPQTQMNRDLSQNNLGKSSDFLQPSHMSRDLKSSENVGAISSEKMKEIKQSTAKGLHNSPNKRQANAVKSLQLNQVEGGHKTEENMDKQKKNQNSVAKNCQDVSDKVVEVGAEELATSNDTMRDVGNTSKRTKKTRSVEPSAVNVDLDSSTEHITNNVDSIHVRSANTLESKSRKKEAKVDTHNQVEVSKCEGDGIDFKHYFMPAQHKNEVVCADKGTTRTERDMKTRKNPKKIVLASSKTLADLPNSLQSYKNQESGVKSHIKSSCGIDLQESFSKDVSSEFLLSCKKSSEVSGNVVKASRSHDSGQIKTLQPAQRPIVASVSGNRTTAPAYGKGKKVSSAASSSSSSSESSDKSLQARRNNNRVSSLDLHPVAGRKASTKNSSEVISSSQREKSLLTTPAFIFRDDDGESSASEDGSDASTRTPSANVSSLGLDGESESSMDSPRNGSNGVEGREGGENVDKPHSSQLKNVTMGMIFRRSNIYKKAKLTAAESQPEDSGSQPVDCVPDSQANP